MQENAANMATVSIRHCTASLAVAIFLQVLKKMEYAKSEMVSLSGVQNHVRGLR